MSGRTDMDQSATGLEHFEGDRRDLWAVHPVEGLGQGDNSK
jgi:hypothetical protein